MGVGSVIVTFVMCILFNVLLPSGDIGSDLKLMYLALTFNLGDSLVLEGCKLCYNKNQEDVYGSINNLEKNSSYNKCKTCQFDPRLSCGSSIPILKKMIQLEAENENCLNDKTIRLTQQDRLEFGECEKEINNFEGDGCCITKHDPKTKENPIPKLDRNKLFHSCFSGTKELEFCFVAGKESGNNCIAMTGFTIEEIEQFIDIFQQWIDNEMKKYNSRSSIRNESIIFFPYTQNNKTTFLEQDIKDMFNLESKEMIHSVTDSDIDCGILMYRHKISPKPSYVYHCNEDYCLTHLRSLHGFTTIYNLNEWRKRTDYVVGVKVGGLLCRLLRIYGTSILIPIFLNLLFNVVLFFNDYKEKKSNIVEVLPLLCLVYPQYKTMKFLAQYLFIHRNEEILKKEKEENNRDVASLEPFLESCLQVNSSSKTITHMFACTISLFSLGYALYIIPCFILGTYFSCNIVCYRGIFSER